MTEPPAPNDLFDAHYFAHGCGPRPYRRDEVWLALFRSIADHIVDALQPASVLDAGCALGLLVECLRRRSVDAFGIDISEYAIQNVHPDARPYCRVGSVTQELDRPYDLIVCIEVLEHLDAREAESAVANFCQHAPSVLFSSSPSDFKEPTHCNVQPPEYWSELFARHGFYRDVDFDATFVTPWAVLYQRRNESMPRLVRDYERRYRELLQENSELRASLRDLRRQLAAQASTAGPAPERHASPQDPDAEQRRANPQHAAQQVARETGGRRPVLLISHDVIGPLMAGPGIRYWQLARVLARHFDVVLAIPHESPEGVAGDGFAVARYTRGDWPSIQPHVDAAQVVVFPSDTAYELPALGQCDAVLVVDGYDPILSEWLPLTTSLGLEAQQQQWSVRMSALTRQFLVGDFYLCASERQRDWWLGQLEANGRINAYTYQADPALRKLVDVVPFGLEAAPPLHAGRVLKGVWPGIASGDRVVVWGGGLWTWLDPLTAIRALAEVAARRDDVRLLFPGTKRPNSLLDSIPTYNEHARALARELGLLDRVVFFGDWVPYDLWPALLRECDLALTLHHDTFESRLAFRSRVLDYIAAGLPVVATRGDATADLIAHYELGELVDPSDAAGVAQSILRLLDEPRSARAERFSAAQAALTWEQAARPLIDFCRAPQRAPDRARGPLGSPYYLEQVDLEERRIAVLQQEAADLRQQIEYWRDEVAAWQSRWNQLETSLGYPLLKRLQTMRARLTPPNSQRERWLLAGAQAAHLARQGGPFALARQAVQRVQMTGPADRGQALSKWRGYGAWIEDNEPDALALKRQRDEAPAFAFKPLISIVTPVYNTPPAVLSAMLDSVYAQTYANWELCLVDGASTRADMCQMLSDAASADPRVRLHSLDSNLGISGNSNVALAQARGEFIALLDHDDVLAPFAFYEVVRALNANRDWDVIYSDNDVLSEDGRTRFHPLFKPDWSPEIMLSANYMTHLTVARTTLVRELGGFCPEMDGAQDWDLFLRLSERTTKIAHIPQMLYHWRDSAGSTATDDQRKPYARSAQLKTIAEHLRRQGLREPRAFVDASGFIRVAWAYERTPRVSLIVPSNGANVLLERCVNLALEKTRYPNFEIVIVNNGARRPAEFAYYTKIGADPRVHVVHDDRPFNYSAANNLGVQSASGDVLVFLNNDIEVLDADWLDEIVMWLARREVGALGAKLLLPNNRIQHAGVVVGMSGYAGHLFAGDPEGRGSIFGFAEWYRDYLAVTGACLALRRDVFQQIGGFDESFILCGSDVELCLRVLKLGYRVVYDPFLRLKHHESATRGADVPRSDFEASFAHYLPYLQGGDPYFNPHLSYWSTVPALRQRGEQSPLQFAREHLGAAGSPS